MSVIALAAILVDISRISAGDALVKKAVRCAARSSLAEYSTNIKENYGIFALSPEKCSDIENNAKMYLEGNLTPPYKNGDLKLYDFRIEKLEVIPLFNLSEDEVFRRQILEYMKFRAPEKMVEGFIDRLDIFKDTGKMSEAYKKKVAIDKLAGGMDKHQQKLKKSVDGTGTVGEKFINGFNKDGCLKNAYIKFLGYKDKYKNYLSEVSSIEASITAVMKELECLNIDSESEELEDLDVSDAANSKNAKKDNNSNKGNAKNEERKKKDAKRKDINDRLNILIDSKNEASGLASEVQSSVTSILNEMRLDFTEPYISLNESAAENVVKIIEAGEKVSIAANELEAFLKNNFGVSNPLLSDFLKTATEDITKLKKLLLSGEKAEAMLSGFAKNSSKLRELSEELQKASSLIDNDINLGNASDRISSLISEYNNKIDYNYEKPEKGNKKDDPRSGKAEAVKQFLEEKILNDKNYLSSGIKADELPSKTKLTSSKFDIEDEPYLRRGIEDKANDNMNEAVGEKSSKTAGNLGNEVDLYNEEGTFQENAFGSIGNMGAILNENIAKLRDELYINEYVMGTFKTAVPQAGEGTAAEQDIDLRGRTKSARNTFYDYEVEYILHGKSSQNTNKVLTVGQLLLVRFGMDTLHVYTDGKKKALANATAAAVAGWWTGGAGIPVISNLIMAGWGMGEALIDVHDLMDGKKVPIYKSKGDWKLDIGLPKEGPKTDSKLAFSYHDYLRLFLLTMDSKSKLGRMEDLIQLNIGKQTSGFKMSSCSTYIRVEAVVSMKYLFATQAFMPANIKTHDGRHIFKVLVYDGY